MQQMATITGKMQITLPIRFAKKLGLRRGQKVVFTEQGDQLVLTPATELVEQLAGSLKIYKKSGRKSLERIIEEAKETYFKNHKA